MVDFQSLLEKAKQEKTVTSLTPEYKKFEKKGDKVLGRFRSKGPVASGMGEGTYNQYLFDTDNGLVKFALGGAADKEFETLLKPGNVYLITYDGQEKIAGGRRVNKFKLDLIAVGTEVPATDDLPEGF